MEQFLEGNGSISIKNAVGTSFRCAVEIFELLEPDYVRVSEPYLSRLWIPEVAAKKDGKNQVADEFYTPVRFAQYISRIALYQAAYTQKYACLTDDIITAMCSYETGWQSADQHLELSQADIDSLDPVLHASGVPRWIVDSASPTMTIADVGLRERTIAEMQVFQAYVDWEAEEAAKAAQTQAHSDFVDMPDWVRTGTLEQAETYIENNVTDLASAKAVLKQFAKMLVLMRDYIRIYR